MRRATELLARLERHALDERRLALAARAAELERRQAEIGALERRLEIEHGLAFELPGGPQPLAAYARVALAQTQLLRATEAGLHQAVAVAGDQVRQRLLAWKALDLVAGQLREKESQAALLAAQREVDEASALRGSRRSELGR